MTGRPTVLIAIKGLGIGGAEKLISEAVDFWNRDEFDYRVAYFLPWKDQLVAELTDAGVQIDMIGSERGMDVGAPSRLRRLIASTEASLVHVHSPAVGVLARTVSPVPVVYTEHNVVDSYRQPTRTLNRLTYRRNAAVIAVSDAVAESLLSFPGPAPRVIRNGVHCHVTPDEAAGVRRELGVGDRPFVVHVGNIRPYKGHRNLIAAAGIIRESVDDVLVVSAGVEKNPGDQAALQAEIEESDLVDTVRLLGRREDARALLAAADVVVNPSDVEGLPIVVLEAMALGRPIVATSVGGVPTIVRDRDTGLLVPPSDPGALAGGVVELLADRALAISLGGASQQLVDEEFSLEAMVTAVEDVYRTVLL